MVRTSLAAGFLLLLAAAALSPAREAFSEGTNHVAFEARVEPPEVGVDGKGTLVLVGKILPHVHVFADQRLKVVPLAVAGVTYGKHETTKPQPWTSPEQPDEPPEKVWFDRVEVRLPFTLAADAPSPAKVGASLKWESCDEKFCFPPEKQSVEVRVARAVAREVRAAEPAPLASGAEEPAALPPPRRREPTGVPGAAPATPAPAPPPVDDLPDPAPPGGPVEAPPTPVAPAQPPPSVAAPPPPAPGAGRPARPVILLPLPTAGETPPPATQDAPAHEFPEPHDKPRSVVTVRAKPGEVSVTVAPKPGFHAYVGNGKPDEVRVEGRAPKNLRWEKARAPLVPKPEVSEPVVFVLPYVVEGPGPASGTVNVRWTICADESNGGRCFEPVGVNVDLQIGEPAATAPPGSATAPGSGTPPAGTDGAGSAPSPTGAGGAQGVGGAEGDVLPPAAGAGERGLLFPVTGEKEKSYVERKWEELGILILGPIFLIGLFLAFTPCVLPIIPITVSIIGGGRADLPRSRLIVLLVSYVLGLSTAFGSLGLVAALSGASISAAFESPVALWVIGGIFVVLAFGMFGLYELQPPAFLQRVQGQRKGGSVPAAFLFGALAAVIASPCTGPVIAAMLLFTAQGGNEVVGFLMFFTLGLGMGAVFFAAGALNFVMRPGPWMVWVRYVFGVLLVGVALFYLANSEIISPLATFAMGFAIAALVAVGIARHLVKKEGEAVAPAAARGVKAALLVVLVTGVVAFLTRPTEAVSFGDSAQTEPWITLRDRAHLKAEVDRARGRPVVVDTTADWCHYCKKWEEFIATEPLLRDAFAKMARLQIDLSKTDGARFDSKRLDLRSAIGSDPDQQPFFVFLDGEGRIRRDLDLAGPPNRDEMMRRLKTLGVAP